MYIKNPSKKKKYMTITFFIVSNIEKYYHISIINFLIKKHYFYFDIHLVTLIPWVFFPPIHDFSFRCELS